MIAGSAAAWTACTQEISVRGRNAVALSRTGCVAQPHLFLATLALAGLFTITTGCQHDERITLAELVELERQVEVADEPVPVVAEQIALSDYQAYRIAAGDILATRILGLMEDRYNAVSLQLRVHDDGNIYLPVVGAIQLQGLTLAEAEKAIIDKHVPNIVTDMSVFVELVTPGNTTVLVLGAAAQPGLVTLQENECNPLYALAAAGGFTEAGSGVIHVRPVDPEQQAVTYNLNRINDVRRALLSRPLQPGDVVEVEGAPASSIYVTGLVNQPGAISVPANTQLSIRRVIATAGGLREYLDIKDATLIRRLDNGEQVQVKIKLNDVLKGEEVDVAMQAGDILDVTPNLDTFVQEWAMRNLLLGPFQVTVRYDPLAQYNANRALESDRLFGGNAASSIRSSLASEIPQLLIPQVQP
jgi:polysaccharide export outer membrane protein